MSARDDAVKAAYHALQGRWTYSGDAELTEADAAAVVDAVTPILQAAALRSFAGLMRWEFDQLGNTDDQRRTAGIIATKAEITADRLEREAGRG